MIYKRWIWILVNKNKNFDRRNFLHKLVGLTALGGIASLILGQKVEKVNALDTLSTGAANQITFWSDSQTITGSNNLRWYEGDKNFIGGYSGNSVTSGVVGATISGGGASGNVNKATDNYGTVGGGMKNQAGDGDGDITNAINSTVGGGADNTASGEVSTVGGGLSNTSSQYASTIGGGENNKASGMWSTVLGGYSNEAGGDFSLAAGRNAKVGATHNGTFLFADSTEADFNSANADEFAVRCINGSRFVAGSSNPAIKGENTGSGNGLYGESSSGNGVYAKSNSGNALYVDGKNYFKSAQRGTIPSGQRYHDVDLTGSGITISENAMIFVTLMGNTDNIGVKYVERIDSDKFRIHLTGRSRREMSFGYFIVN